MERILLVEPNYVAKFKPLGLMRISTYHKRKGDEVVFVKGEQALEYVPDRIYITTLFTYRHREVIRSIRFYRKRYPESEILVGGILATLMPETLEKEDVKIHVGILPEVEECPPDYSLFPDMDYSLTTTSRGCVNRCAFCVVAKIEPKFYNRDWLKDINPNFKKIIFMDNNWLAKDWDSWVKDVELLHELKKEQHISEIDFNQSLDCRIFSEKHMKLLKGLPLRPIRFSFDHLGQDKHIQNAIAICKKYGLVEVRVDVLYNYKDTIEDFYYRIKEIARMGACSIPMRYAPIYQTDKDYVGEHWTMKEVMGVSRIIPMRRAISFFDLESFEYFFGRDAQEFKKMINYNQIEKLTSLKFKKYKREKANGRQDKLFEAEGILRRGDIQDTKGVS